MALRGTLTHWKTRMLGIALGIKPCYALGILEALWHTTAELAPTGNIGRLPNEAIAMEMFYDGDANELIDALVKSRHLEEHPEHRLIVHDWMQHSDHNTKRKVIRRGEAMIANDGSPQVMTRHKSIPVPVPVPEPVPVPKEKAKTSLAKRESDPRHVAFRLAIQSYTTYKAVEFIWDASEAKQLSLLLSAAPDLTLLTFQACLNHRARSPGTPHGERPRLWLPNVLKYQEAPLNEFGKTGAANGNRNSKTSGNINAAQSAFDLLDAREAHRGDADGLRLPAGSGE
jgi:hypothetical protein